MTSKDIDRNVENQTNFLQLKLNKYIYLHKPGRSEMLSTPII